MNDTIAIFSAGRGEQRPYRETYIGLNTAFLFGPLFTRLLFIALLLISGELHLFVVGGQSYKHPIAIGAFRMRGSGIVLRHDGRGVGAAERSFP